MGVTTSRATSGGKRKDRNTSSQRRNRFNTSYRDISVIVQLNNGGIGQGIGGIRKSTKKNYVLSEYEFNTAVKDICTINTFEKLLKILSSEVYC